MSTCNKKKLYSFIIIMVLSGTTLFIIPSVINSGQRSHTFRDLNPASNSILLKNITINDSENGIGAHNWTWAANQKWCSGNGTFSDPFIINNVTVDSNFTGNGITIKNSRKFFQIKNCTIINNNQIYLSGIKLLNVSNGLIFNNSIENNDQGINIEDCFNVTIELNKFESNSDNNIHLVHSNNNTIQNNTIFLGVYGILLNNNSDYNIVYNNYIESTIIGIAVLNHSDYNEIKFNNLLNNNKCTYQDDDCIGNIFLNNNCNQNSGGFFLIIIYISVFALLFAIPTVLINKYIRKKHEKKKDEDNVFGI